MPDLVALLTAEAERLIAAARGDEPPVLFLSGPQGSGKTTLTNRLLERVKDSVCLSLDDFYLSKAERQALAETVHPLFETRGPPGTHHVDQLAKAITELKQPRPGHSVTLPVFDKRRDDVLPETKWRRVDHRTSLIILEGWLLGIAADPEAPSSDPINQIETRDAEGVWRQYQEAMLATKYQDLWTFADQFIYLDTDAFANIYQWRMQQEEQTLGLAPGALPRDRQDWVTQFIGHYERLTRRSLAGDRRPGTSIQLDLNRGVIGFGN